MKCSVVSGQREQHVIGAMRGQGWYGASDVASRFIKCTSAYDTILNLELTYIQYGVKQTRREISLLSLVL